ncbi:MAG: Kelch repeat-containing protein [Planctomycetaceae bacterium]
MFKYLFAAAVIVSANPLLAQTSEVKLPDLPHAITSFGAATTKDGHLYVYGGHKGDAHHYNVEGQSNSLLRLNLKKPAKWEPLTTGPRLQGLALVTDGESLYRVGGFTAMNKGEAEQKLSSQTSVAQFSPKTNRWTDLTPLPEPRSSFDAVVHQDKLYVIGGWNMQPDGTDWLSTAWVADLKASPLKWKELPKPPFERRALSLAAVGDSVYAVGGMTKEGPTKSVSVFNIKNNTWSEGPELPGKSPMSGFGSSSFTIGSRLFASTYDGSVLELAADGKSWKTFKTLSEGRFFHRMVPMNKSALLLISGANMETGKYEDVVTVSID